jgi:formiminotetrahydrofolate cyclodeaminase
MAEKDMLAMSVRDFVAQTAAKTPTPGGGSVAGLTGALGAALGEMALVFTQGKKKYAEHEPFYAELKPRLEKARKAFEDLVAADVSAYEMYQAATRLADADPGKPAAAKRALEAAINVPREATRVGLALLDDLLAFSDRCSPYLISDLAAGAALAVAAIQLSDYNVRVNALQVSDKGAADNLRAESLRDVRRGQELLDKIEQAVRKHLPR